MTLMCHLTYIYERCRSVSELTPTQHVQVKGKDYILDVLETQHLIVKSISSVYPSLADVEKSMYDSIVYLDRKYTEKRRFLSTKNLLEHTDAKKLSSDVMDWITSILEVYKERGTHYIIHNNLEELFSEQLLSVVDKSTNTDLEDAFQCIIHLMPTPAAMISFRAAESIVRHIYEKITGSHHDRKSWSTLINELERNQTISGPFIGYLDYLRDKRNEAEHPDKRFEQEESERILLQIKALLDESLKL